MTTVLQSGVLRFVHGVLIAASAAIAIGFVMLAYQKPEIHIALKNERLHSRSDNALKFLTPSTSSDGSNFVRSLAPTARIDAQFRYLSTLSQSQHVTFIQLQQDTPQKSDKRQLPQVHLTLQLRGDYRDIKAVTSATLDKFPGLVLQHMTIRHHVDNGPAAPSADDRDDDQATLELTQYLRPAQSF